MTTFKEYQTLAHTTSLNTMIGNCPIAYPILGLGDEAGECQGKLKKLFRDKNGVVDEKFKEDMTKELGDVLWYIAESCTQLGLSLEDVAAKNVEKLLDRKERNVIQGSGDNR